MTDHTVFYSEPMLLRFDSYEGRVAKGRLKTLRYQTVFSFDSMDQLFMIMDDVLDAGGFPKRGQGFRYLKTEEGEAGEKESGLGKPAYVFWKLGPADRDPENDKGAGTGGFHGQMTVTVCRREYGSMQGTVNIKGKKTHFRSALELMRMFHEYLERNLHAYV